MKNLITQKKVITMNDYKFPDDDISQFLVVRFRTYAYAECC